MDKAYLDMLTGNKIQAKYFHSVIVQRNDYCDRAFEVPISDYFPNGNEKRTPLELAYHALTPLYKFGTLLTNHDKSWDNIEIEPISGTATEQFLKLYDDILELVEHALSSIKISEVGGEFAEFKENEEELKRRFGIFTMHAIAHMGQAIKFQGLISQELAQREVTKMVSN